MIKKQFQSLKKKGFFYIFGLNVFNKIIQFCSGIFIVRLLSKEEYGLFSYIMNIFSLYIIINGAGSTTGLLQFGSEADNNEKRYTLFYYALKRGLKYSLITGVILYLSGLFLPFKFQSAGEYISLMFFYPPLIFLLELIQVMFRASLENKKYSFCSGISSASLLFFTMLGAYLFKIRGIILFRYITYALLVFFSFILFHTSKKKKKNTINIPGLSKEQKSKFNTFSWISTGSNAISQLLYLIDVFLIGIIIGNEEVIASYKVATTIPFALNFIPLSIMTFVYPYFARKYSDKKWMKKSYYKLTLFLACTNLLITSVLFIYAPFVIELIFENQYMDSVRLFRILIIGYFIVGTFRIPAGNTLASMRKVKINLYMSLFAGIFNIIFDIIMIRRYGSTGAAISTLSVFVLTSVIYSVYLQTQLQKV